MRPRNLIGPILGVESSCDETAAAILSAHGEVMAHRVFSQSEHDAFGGVVPEIAARTHLAVLPSLVRETIRQAGVDPEDLCAVAASVGPGLIGGLIVGSGFAKGTALALNKPFIAVNHLEAHALTARLPAVADRKVEFPYLALLVSGGHCQCVAVEAVGVYRRLGGTMDDSIGEAFDKVGKILGLGWPGGPAIERLAQEGDPWAFALPRPLKGRSGCNFSWSGLKTAVAQIVAKAPAGALPRHLAADLAASFQQAVVETIYDRVDHALRMVPGCTALVAGGGVAANEKIRAELAKIASCFDVNIVIPPNRLCTDNAVMVCWAALERLASGANEGLAVSPRPRWSLEEMVI